jgi:uncharacterized protein involved in outer membrane biogenesis
MKKLILRLALAVVILLILGVVAIGFLLDGLLKRGVETVGPTLTKSEVKLDSATISVLSGSGKLKGLLVGNPAGFKSPSAIQVGTASMALQPGSLFSSKVIIRSINVQSPEITFETDLKGNNLSKLVENLQASTGGSRNIPATTTSDSRASKKVQVDDFLITGGKVHVTVTVLGSQSATVALPEIHLTGLGQGPEGITVAELTKRILQVVEKEAVQASASALDKLIKDPANLTKALQTSPSEAADRFSKGVGGFLRKK